MVIELLEPGFFEGRYAFVGAEVVSEVKGVAEFFFDVVHGGRLELFGLRHYDAGSLLYILEAVVHDSFDMTFPFASSFRARKCVGVACGVSIDAVVKTVVHRSQLAFGLLRCGSLSIHYIFILFI